MTKIDAYAIVKPSFKQNKKPKNVPKKFQKVAHKRAQNQPNHHMLESSPNALGGTKSNRPMHLTIEFIRDTVPRFDGNLMTTPKIKISLANSRRTFQNKQLKQTFFVAGVISAPPNRCSHQQSSDKPRISLVLGSFPTR